MQVAKWGNSLAVRLPSKKRQERGNCWRVYANIMADCPPIFSSRERISMKEADVFFDTNVLLYWLSADAGKADCAEQLLSIGGIVSVQVVNEFTSIALKKLRMPWTEIRDVLAHVRVVCPVVDLTGATHDCASEIAERYGLSFCRAHP